MNIAWIGTGVMGTSMVRHLIDAGHTVYVYNRTKSKCKNLVKYGAIELNSVSEAPLKAEVIFTMLGYPKDVEEVYLSEIGVLSNISDKHICVDMTTSSPTLAQKIAVEMEKRGAEFLDMPVTGGDIGAKNGTLTVFVGGDEKILNEKIKPIVSAFSKTVTYFGNVGNGQYAKLGNQVAIASTMISLAESYEFAKKIGLDTKKFLETISLGSAGSFSMNSYGARILNNDYKPGFYIHHFIKDMGLALDECRKMDIKLPGLKLAYDMYTSLAEEIKQSEGTQAIIKYYE